MTFRFRLGPFTFGRSGTRLSLWGRSGGISIPLTGKKGHTFGKLAFGPFRWFFNRSKNTQKKIEKHSEIEERTDNQNSYQSTAITAIQSDQKYLNKLRQYGIPWRGVQERIKEELPVNLTNRDKIAYGLVPKIMEAIFGQQNIGWMTEKRPSKNGNSLTTWIIIL